MPTLRIVMYLGGDGSDIPSCGFSSENPCSSFNQILLNFNRTLFSEHENFTLLEGKRNVHLQILITNVDERSIYCPVGQVNLIFIESMYYVIEMSKLNLKNSFTPTLTCRGGVAISIPQVNTVYFHHLNFKSIVVKYDSGGARALNIMFEECIVNNVLIGESVNRVREVWAKYFIVEKSLFISNTVPLRVVYTDQVFILKSSFTSLLGVQFGNKLNIEESSMLGLGGIVSNLNSFTLVNSTITRMGIQNVDNVEFSNVNTDDSNSNSLQNTVYINGYSGKKWSFTNCNTSRGHDFAQFQSVDNLHIEGLSFAPNSYSSSGLTLITVTNCYETVIVSSKFPKGVGSIQIPRYYEVDVVLCEFNNDSPLVIGRTLPVESTQSKIFIAYTTFSGSKSQYGPLYIEFGSVLLIYNCVFKDNVASISGGAVYVGTMSSKLRIEQSSFINNRVECNSIPSLDFCSGGALSFNSSYSDINTVYNLEKCTFARNCASRGGVFYFGKKKTMINVVNSEFNGNSVKLTGSIAYFNYNEYLYNTENVESKDNVSPSNIDFSGSTTFNSVSVMGAFNRNEQFELSIGKTYNLSLIGLDGRGNETSLVQDLLSVESSDPRLTMVLDQKIDSISFNLYFFVDSTQNLTMIGFENIFTIITPNKDLKLSVLIIPCEQGFNLEKIATEKTGVFMYDCRPLPEVPYGMFAAIIVGCSMFVFILGISIGLVIYCVWNTIKKLNRLKRKERAEKQMEDKLLEKRIVFEINDDEDTYKENASQKISYGKVSDTELVSSLLGSESKKSKQTFSMSSSYIIPIEDVTIIKKIGEGGAANVYYGTWSNIKVAIKSLKSDLQQCDFDEDFEREAAILSNLRHPHVLTFYGFCLTDKSRYIVTEFMENGSLERYIANNRQRSLTIELFKSIVNILSGVSKGMQYLHSLKPSVIHRDLKSGNILLDDRNNPKVSDFGLVKVLGNNTFQSQMTKAIGTLYFMAPESFLTDHQIDNKEQAKKLDVYSFSIIMWEIFFRASPYQHVQNAFKVPQLVINGQRPHIPFDIENDEEIRQWLEMSHSETSTLLIGSIKKYLQIMVQCWNQNPMDRPSFSVIRQELEDCFH